MNRKTALELLDWTLVNIVTPFAIPFFFALFWKMFYPEDYDLIKTLLNNGVYTFYTLLILISLFQDYRSVPEAFSILLYITISVCFIFTFVFFGESLGVIPKIKIENLPLVTLFPFLAVALLFKYHITRKKQKK